MRRSRPLLGTFVDISIEDDLLEANSIFQIVFGRIEDISNKLSFHNPASELSIFNSSEKSECLTISEDFAVVLKTSLEISAHTGGVFNPAIAPILQAHGTLPKLFQTEFKSVNESVRFIDNFKIEILNSVCLDFGGIAKGYAVDQACFLLKKFGVKNALVNAGGDIRAIGDKAQKIQIRHPVHPEKIAFTLNLKEKSIATSLCRNSFRGQLNSSIVNGVSGEPCYNNESVTIVHNSCMIADALSKVAFLLPKMQLETLLEIYNATLFVTETSVEKSYLSRSSTLCQAPLD